MIAWMAYATVVGLVLASAAWLAERGLRRQGRLTRWVWLVAMAGTIGAPLGLFLAGLVGAGTSAFLGTPSPVSIGPGWWAGLPWTGSGPVNGALLGAWLATSVVLLTSLRLALWTLRRNERSWRAVWVAGRRAVLSEKLGPGVIGAARPRIVLPVWLLEADTSLQRLVVRHEEEHVRAGDPRLLLAGLVLSAAVPWCLPIWWQLHRLREAIEADCDVRVLARSTAAGDYARALVEVAGRQQRRLPVPTLAPRPGELERRIRLITGPPGRSDRVAASLLLAAVVLVVALSQVSPPEPPEIEIPRAAGVVPPPAVRVFLSVEEATPGQRPSTSRPAE